ncbi:MAG: hypothetical protein R3C40_01045 [Parvularculaceae bacterium]
MRATKIRFLAVALALAPALISLAPALIFPAQARPYDDIMGEARDAFAAEDFKTAADRLDEAQITRPYSLYLTRNRILTRILTDRMDEAIAIAAQIAERGLVLNLPAHEAFDAMKADPAYAPVAEKMAENAAPVGAPEIVLEHDRADLLPEALAMNDGAFYVGSVRSGEILEFSDGAVRTLGVLEGGVFDIEIDGDVLVGVSNNQLAYERTGERAPGANLFRIDRSTGATLSQTAIGENTVLIGDLEIGADGRVFVSNSLTPHIYSLDKDGALHTLGVDPRFVNLQGIALDRKKQRLFVADYLAGLFIIDLKTGDVAAIDNPSDAHLGGIDGLYLYKGDLIGIQNGATPQRIVKIDLSRKGKTAKSVRVLQRALPEWTEPTHGVVAGDEFFYIATSNWPAYDVDGAPVTDAEMAPLRIMRVKLD